MKGHLPFFSAFNSRKQGPALRKIPGSLILLSVELINAGFSFLKSNIFAK